jgi:hypothetical protein
MTHSRRTGGPKTAEGKAVSSWNALKTGAYSHSITLPGEQASEFWGLSIDWLRCFRYPGCLSRR